MNITRRSAIKHTAALSVGAALAPLIGLRAQEAPDKKIKVAVIALSRGMALVNALLSRPDVEIAYVAEVDPKRLEAGLKTISAKQDTTCQGVEDFRRILEDETVEAIFIAAPNFWHTPMALLAMQAGKHVYVEKPGSGTPQESEMIVEAAKKYNRLVQMGNQRRTWMREAIDELHGGVIGEVKFARAFYYNARAAVAQGAQKHGEGINMDLWQGPLTSTDNMASLVHY
ncbi:MAG: Gfo/Idh/MocA family protein, partial [Chthoniobacteraceae bacterium]